MSADKEEDDGIGIVEAQARGLLPPDGYSQTRFKKREQLRKDAEVFLDSLVTQRLEDYEREQGQNT